MLCNHLPRLFSCIARAPRPITPLPRIRRAFRGEVNFSPRIEFERSEDVARNAHTPQPPENTGKTGYGMKSRIMIWICLFFCTVLCPDTKLVSHNGKADTINPQRSRTFDSIDVSVMANASLLPTGTYFPSFSFWLRNSEVQGSNLVI